MTGSPDAPAAFVLRGGRVLIGAALAERTIVIEGSRIAALLPEGTVARPAPDIDPIVARATVVDVAGAIVAPGFIDTHVHGALGRNLMEGSREAVDAVAAHLLTQGVTSFAAGTASVGLERMLDAIGRLAGVAALPPRPGTPALLGTHLEGPFLSPERAGVHRREHLLAPTRERIEQVLAAADGTLRVVTLAPELPEAMEAIDALVAAGVTVAVGHTDADLRTTQEAIDRGARRATHLFNAMPPVHHRRPGAVPALLADPRVHLEVVADGEHVSPDLLATLFSSAGLAERLMLVSDGTDVTGLPDGSHRRWEGTEIRMVGGRSWTPDGGIAGSTRSVLDGVRLLVDAGVPVAAALHAAGTAPARSLGLADRGMIARGAVADLVVIDPQLELQSVFVRGVPIDPGSPHDPG